MVRKSCLLTTKLAKHMLVKLTLCFEIAIGNAALIILRELQTPFRFAQTKSLTLSSASGQHKTSEIRMCLKYLQVRHNFNEFVPT